MRVYRVRSGLVRRVRGQISMGKGMIEARAGFRHCRSMDAFQGLVGGQARVTYCWMAWHGYEALKYALTLECANELDLEKYALQDCYVKLQYSRYVRKLACDLRR